MNNEDRDQMIQATHDAVLTIQIQCKQCRGLVRTHDTALRGNDRPGLTTRVGKLELLVCSMGGGLVAAVLGGVVAWALA